MSIITFKKWSYKKYLFIFICLFIVFSLITSSCGNPINLNNTKSMNQQNQGFSIKCQKDEHNNDNSIDELNGFNLIYGPKLFVRNFGKPKVITDTFTVSNLNQNFILLVQGGEFCISCEVKCKKYKSDLHRILCYFKWNIRKNIWEFYKKHHKYSHKFWNGLNFPASGSIKINGEEIVSEDDFKGNVSEIVKIIELQSSNTIEVLLKSKPLSSIKVTIIGDQNVGPDPEPTPTSNHPPEVGILTANPNPVSGAGYPTAIKLTVSDVETPITDLTYTWKAVKSGESNPVGSFGNTIFKDNFVYVVWTSPIIDTSANYEITLTVSDGINQVTSTPVFITVKGGNSEGNLKGRLY